MLRSPHRPSLGRPTDRAHRPRRARILGTALAAVSAVALAGCWPAPGQGPDRAAYNPFETTIGVGNVATLAPVWTATTDSATASGGTVGPPIVANSAVVVSDTAGLYSFDRRTGARLWTTPSPPVIAGAVADPIADGGRVLHSEGFPVGFGGSWNAFAEWLDAGTGAQVAPAPSARITGRRGSKLASFSTSGGPFVGVSIFTLSVLDETTPSAGWGGTLQFSNGGLFGAQPATLGAQRLYYAGTATESFDPAVNVTGVRAFSLTRPATCASPPEGFPQLGTIPCPLWKTPTTGVPVTSPVLGPGETALYVATSTTMLALDAADGHVLWSAALPAAPSADPALAAGWLYVPLENGDLAVLAAGGCGSATCPIAWRSTVGGAGVQPAVAGGVVFVGTDAGKLVALPAAGCGAATCPSIWEHDFGAAVTGAPAVTGGRVYVGVAPDKVVAFAPS
jgi:outer membrane protein assembly factor BamB